MLFLAGRGGSRWGYPLFSPGLFVNTPSHNFPFPQFPLTRLFLGCLRGVLVGWLVFVPCGYGLGGVVVISDVMQQHKVQVLRCGNRPHLAFREFIKGELWCGMKERVLARCGGRCERCGRERKGLALVVVRWPGNWKDFRDEDVKGMCWFCSKRRRARDSEEYFSGVDERWVRSRRRYEVLGEAGVAENGKKIIRVRTW